jgi:hypothetical protein
MNFSFHFFRPRTPAEEIPADTLPITPTADVHWNRPVFRAPTLPTPQQFHRDLPFSVNFRCKDRWANRPQ